MTGTLLAERVVEDCPVLRALEVRKQPAVFQPNDWDFPSSIEGQFDLFARFKGEDHPPAYRRVSENWELRQPIDMLNCMGFDNFALEWGFRHAATELLFENKVKGRRASIVGVRLFFEAPLEERYTKNLGKHSIQISINLHWNGQQSDRLRVWLLDRWCENGQTNREGLYSVNVNHSKSLIDHVDKREIYCRIEEHLQWKSDLSTVKLARPIEAELVRLFQGHTDNVKPYLDNNSDNPLAQETFDIGCRDLVHHDLDSALPDEGSGISKGNRVITWYRSYDGETPYISRRLLNRIGEAINAESLRSTWGGDSLLDLTNVVTRMYCQGDKVLSAAAERRFEALVSSYN